MKDRHFSEQLRQQRSCVRKSILSEYQILYFPLKHIYICTFLVRAYTYAHTYAHTDTRTHRCAHTHTHTHTHNPTYEYMISKTEGPRLISLWKYHLTLISL